MGKAEKMNLLQSFFTEAYAVIRDVYAAFLDVIYGPELTPEQVKAYNERHAEPAPDYWHGKVVKAVEVPETFDRIETKTGGFAVGWNGSMIYSDTQTVAELTGWKEVQSGGEITENDYGAMLAHTPKLTNVALAKAVKPLWIQGKTSHEISLLVGCSESYVKHYLACFRLANHYPIR